jgi:cbb3-type cytochrome oxidase maturation protein
MSILYVLLPLMLAVAGGAVLAFVWAARRGQLDDLETPPLRMLVDDDGSVYGSRRRRDDP